MSEGGRVETITAQGSEPHHLELPRFLPPSPSKFRVLVSWLARHVALIVPLALLPLFLVAGLTFASRPSTTRVVVMLVPALFYSGYGIVLVKRFEGKLTRRQNHLEGEMRRRFDEFSPTETRLSRQYFETRLAQEIKRSRRHNLPLCVVALSTSPERAKAVHTLELIELTARTLRSEDSAGRLGRYVYAICLPHTTREGGEAVIDRLRSEFGAKQPQFSLAYLEPGLDSTPAQILNVALDQLPESVAA
jgi:GGDEF domain-containing protein